MHRKSEERKKEAVDIQLPSEATPGLDSSTPIPKHIYTNINLPFKTISILTPTLQKCFAFDVTNSALMTSNIVFQFRQRAALAIDVSRR